MRSSLRASALVALAALAVQAAWILALPPFRGIDEFDHAYRAAAVAQGEWFPHDAPVVRGRGEYLTVPAALVEAAHPVCSVYPYTGRDNCNAARVTGDGRVWVASGAARYNPAFYWVIGKAGSLFAGTQSLYAMRIAAALVNAALLGIAAWGLTVGFRTSWPLLAAVVGMTPVYLYSTALGAPNGTEMAAALSVWASVLALRSPTITLRQQRWLLWLAALASAVLVTTRLLGPVWLLLVLACALPFIGKSRLVTVVRSTKVTVGAGVLVVAVALTGAVAWTLAAAPNSLANEEDLHLKDPVVHSLAQIPVWILQSIAAFPTRDEPAPAVVYAVELVVGILFLAACGRRMRRRWWVLVASLAVCWTAVQFAVTIRTYSHLGPVWQGRYALPLAVGMPVLVAAVAERCGQRPPQRRTTLSLLALIVAAHAVSIVSVQREELRFSPLAGSPAWVTAPSWALVALVVVAGACLWRAVAPASVIGETDAVSLPERTSGERTAA